MAEKKDNDKNDETPESSENKIYTQEQYDAAIAKAQKEVREEREGQIDTLNDKVKILEKATPLKSGDIDVKKLVADAVTAAKKQWEKEHQKDITELQKTV